MSLGSVGSILKSLRKERGLTLKELSQQTGVSISFLSQVEREKSGVTLESLRKIADALNVSPGTFFSPEQEHEAFGEGLEQFHYKDLSHGVTDAAFSPILVTLQPGEQDGRAFSHTGHEFLFVLEGVLTVEIEGRQQELREQASILFDAGKPHYWFNRTDQVVRFLAVSSNG